MHIFSCRQASRQAGRQAGRQIKMRWVEAETGRSVVFACNRTTRSVHRLGKTRQESLSKGLLLPMKPSVKARVI